MLLLDSDSKNKLFSSEWFIRKKKAAESLVIFSLEIERKANFEIRDNFQLFITWSCQFTRFRLRRLLLRLLDRPKNHSITIGFLYIISIYYVSDVNFYWSVSVFLLLWVLLQEQLLLFWNLWKGNLADTRVWIWLFYLH